MWHKQYHNLFEVDYENLPYSTLNEIYRGIIELQSDKPLVSVVVVAYNEERNLPACLLSVSRSICKYPMEIIGIDNNSTDHTSEIYQKTGVRYFKEERKGHGNARNCGLHNARGKYYLCMDSDTIYPSTYVESMVNILEREGVVAVNAHYGFISKAHSLLSLIIYEFVRNINAYAKAIKRPEMMVRGAVFGFVIEPVRLIGFRTNIKRGEDGALAYELKSYGRIIFTKRKQTRAMTSFRSLRGSSSIWLILLRRIGEQMKQIRCYLYSKTDRYKDEDSNILK